MAVRKKSGKAAAKGTAKPSADLPTTAPASKPSQTSFLKKSSTSDTAFIKGDTKHLKNRDAAGDAPPTRDRGSYDGDTAFKLYLREIGQVKLLTPEEEIELADRIKKGDKKAR